MIPALLNSLTISLLLTIALETSFFMLTNRWFTSSHNKKNLLLVLLVNVLTNPIVVLLHWLTALYTNWNATVILILLEVFAVLTEGYYYKKYGDRFDRPYLFSIAANIFSFGTGVLIQMII